LEEIALRRRIPIFDPYQGNMIGDRFWVASPSVEWYGEIIHHFDKTPETKAISPRLAELGRAAMAGGILSDSASPGVGSLWRMAMARGVMNESRSLSLGLAELGRARSVGIVAEAMRTAGVRSQADTDSVRESWDVETLQHMPETSFDNESSVVLYGFIDGQGILLTGDAGVKALSKAVDWLERQSVDLPRWLKVVQVPHHGSRHNVDPVTLDRILGPRLPVGHMSGKVAIASAGARSTHPRKVVTNAFRRRGAVVHVAKGGSFRYFSGLPPRANVRFANTLPLFDQVEA
jgi:hypothetical protein